MLDDGVRELEREKGVDFVGVCADEKVAPSGNVQQNCNSKDYIGTKYLSRYDEVCGPRVCGNLQAFDKELLWVGWISIGWTISSS